MTGFRGLGWAQGFGSFVAGSGDCKRFISSIYPRVDGLLLRLRRSSPTCLLGVEGLGQIAVVPFLLWAQMSLGPSRSSSALGCRVYLLSYSPNEAKQQTLATVLGY